MYVRNTKNYFPPEPKKLTQHHNCIVSTYVPKTISLQKHKNWHNTTTVWYSNYIRHDSTTGKKVSPAHAQRVYLTLCHQFGFCTLIHTWRCQINCSYYSNAKKIEKLLIRVCEFEHSKSNTSQRYFKQFLFRRRNHREKS